MAENINLDDPKVQSTFSGSGFNNPAANKIMTKLPEIKPIYIVFGVGLIGLLLFKDRIIDFIIGDR